MARVLHDAANRSREDVGRGSVLSVAFPSAFRNVIVKPI
jgi:hypothetical protein